MRTPPAFLFAADPASHRTGLAFFERGILKSATLVQSHAPAFETRALHMWTGAVAFRKAAAKSTLMPLVNGEFVMEWPEIYPKMKAKPGDVLKIAGAATAIAMAFVGYVPDNHLRRVLPKTWKGQTKKYNRDDDGEKIYLMWNVIGPALSAAEKAVLDDLPEGAGKIDDVLDAVGVGLHALERI